MQETPVLNRTGVTISDAFTSVGVTVVPFQPMRTNAVTAALKPDMLVDRPQQRRGAAQEAVKLPCRAAR
jgi:hypothetical protein